MNPAIPSPSDNLVCANIGPKERQKRLMAGVVSQIAAVAVVVVIRVTGLPWYLAAATLPLSFGAAIGFFQWQAKTCVANVFRGVTNMDDGYQTVTDEAVKATLARQARLVQLKSFAAAVAQTAVAVALVALV